MSARTIAVILTADSSSLRAQLITAGRQVDEFGASIRDAGEEASASSERMEQAAKGGALALAAALAYSVAQAAEFEAAMRNVNSISGLSETAFRAQSQAVLDLSRRLPQSAKTLAEGLYDIASSGFQGADGLEVLQKSAVAASAGLTTTQNAAKAITAVLNAYGEEASQAGAVSDVLFKTVDLGVVNFEELTGVIGDSIGVAAAAGVSIEEVGSAVATMTLSGLSAAEAGTSLNRMLTELLKPGDELKAVLASLGYESGIAAIQTLGLRGTMDLLRQATGGSAESVVALFKEVRGARGAFALMADEGQRYAQVTEGISHASDGAGAAQNALNEQMKSLSAQWKVFVNDLNAGAIAGGTLLLPFLKDVLVGTRELARDALPGLRSGFEALQPFLRNVAEIGGDVVDIAKELVDALGPLGKALLGVAGTGVVASLNATSSALAALTGFLSDHEQIVTAAALAWAGFVLVTEGAAALAAIPAILDAIAFGLYGAAGAADAAAASLLTLKGAALGIGGLAAILGLTAAISGLQKAQQHADAFYASVVKPFDLSSYKGLTDALSEIEQKQVDLEANTKTHGGLFNAFRGAVELISPMKNSVQDARDALQKLNEEAERLAQVRANVFSNLDSVATATGRPREEIERLAQALGVDLTQGFEESGPARQKIIDNLQSITTNAYGAGAGLSTAFGQSVDDIKAASDAVDELAKKTADAFGKSVDLIGGYARAQDENKRAVEDLATAQDSASSAADRVQSAQDQAAQAVERVADAQDKAAEAAQHVTDAQNKAVEAAQRVTDAEGKVADSEEHLSQLRVDLAERAAEAQQAYQEKVQESDDKILAAEQDLADRRISLAESVAEAQQRLEDDRASSAENVANAEQRLRDVQARNAAEERQAQQRAADQRALDAAKDPAARQRVQAQIDARKAKEEDQQRRTQAAKDTKDAQADIEKARKAADDTERKDREALAKAQLEQAKGIADAEAKVTDARKAGLDVQREGEKLARQQADDERQIADAVKSVESARRDVVKAQDDEVRARDDITRAQKDAAKATDDIARAQSEAAKAGRDVQRAQSEAAKAYDDLAAAQQKVADTSLSGFFARTIRDAETFADGIREAARQGLDPHLIAELLQEGPEKAAPILRDIMADQTGTLVGMFNQAATKTREVQDRMVETARVTQRAINATNTDMAGEFGKAMDILAAKAALGGEATAQAIADKLGLGVGEVQRIAHDYVIVLTDGINPLLKGIGAEPITTPTGETYVQGNGGRFLAATGGQVPGVGDTDSVPAMLTPGEYVLSKPAVERIGLENIEAMHRQARRGYAQGGFVYPYDVPATPDFSAYGDIIGHSGDEAMKKLHDDIARFLADHPPTSNGKPGPGGDNYGFQALIDYLNAKGIENTVTSTTGGGHAEGSRHYMGLAADFVGPSMDAIADAFMDIRASMFELIHNPGYSVKRGEVVDPGYWGDTTWDEHRDHVHAATYENAQEGPGIPGLGGGSGGGASGSLDDWIIQGLQLADKPDSWHDGIRSRAMQESSGDAHAQNNWDSNADAGTPSKGLMQMIDPTFEAYKVPGHDDIWNPVDNVAAAANYIADRYGDPYHLPAGGYSGGGLVQQIALRSYDAGGWLPPGLTLAYNGLGRPESVGGAGIDCDQLARSITDGVVRALAAMPTPVIQVGEKRLGEVVAGALARHRGGRL